MGPGDGVAAIGGRPFVGKDKMGDHRLLTTTASAAPSAIVQPAWIKDWKANLGFAPSPLALLNKFANHPIKVLGVDNDDLRLQVLCS
jgi:hypothetical protein